jgi:hypothetical protein
VVRTGRTLCSATAAGLILLPACQEGFGDDIHQQAPHRRGTGGFHNDDGSPSLDKSKYPDLKAAVDYAHRHELKADWYFNNCYCADPASAPKYFEGDVAFLVHAGLDGVKIVRHHAHCMRCSAVESRGRGIGVGPHTCAQSRRTAVAESETLLTTSSCSTGLEETS